MGRQFVTAGEGLLKVFWSQIIVALTVGLTAFAVLLQAAPLVYLSALVMLVGQILALMGLSEAAVAHGGYRSARLAVLVSLTAGVARELIETTWILSLLNLVALGGSLMLVYLTCRATADLLVEIEEDALAERAALIWKIYVGLLAASFVCNLLAALFYGSITAVVLAGVYLTVQVGSAVLFMVFLFRSQRALRKR